MNKEDIIAMAREAGFVVDEASRQYQPKCIGFTHYLIDDELERFAALVAAHVRETEFKPDWNNYRHGLADGAAEEREACAKVADENAAYWAGYKIAAAIRARGNT